MRRTSNNQSLRRIPRCESSLTDRGKQPDCRDREDEPAADEAKTDQSQENTNQWDRLPKAECVRAIQVNDRDGNHDEDHPWQEENGSDVFPGFHRNASSGQGGGRFRLWVVVT